MATKKFHLVLGGLAGAVLLVAVQARAQQAQRPFQFNQPARQAQQPGQPAAQQQPQQRTALRPTQGEETLADQQIAGWLVICNEKEAKLSQFGVDRGDSKAVKDFADKMVKEHTQAATELRQFAPNAPKLTASNDQRTEQRGDQRTPQTQTRSQQDGQPLQAGGGQGSRGLPYDQVGYQLAQRAIATCEHELKDKQGKDFDHAFMMGEVMGHLEAWNTLHVLKQYASPQLQQSIDKSIKTTEQHLAQAREICEHLKDGHSDKARSEQSN